MTNIFGATSTLTTLTRIPERSDATPGLWNGGYDRIDANFASVQSLLNSSALALPGAGRTTASLASFLGNSLGRLFNPMDYGAVGNGNTDDTAAIASAISAWKASVVAPSAGGVLYLTNAHRVSAVDLANVSGCAVMFDGGALYGQSAGVTGTGQVSASNGAANFQTAPGSALSVGMNVLVGGTNYRVSVYNSGTTATVIAPPGVSSSFASSAFTINPDAVLTVRNSTDIAFLGRVAVTGAYNPGYSAGIACYSDNGTGCTNINFWNPTVAAVKCAYRFGRSSEASAQVSEINVFGGYTFGTPTVWEAYGTQTVIAFNSVDQLSNDFGGPAGWSSITQYVGRVFGATVFLTGGEAQHSENTLGACFTLESIADATNGNYYGSIYASNVQIETAARLAVAQTTLSVTTPLAGSGVLNIQGCSGYHANNSFPYVDLSDVSFTGRVQIGGGSNFFAGVARSYSNVSCAAAAANVYVDDNVFGTNFVQGLQGFVGGTIHFGHRQILSVNNTLSQKLTGSTTTTVKFMGVTVTNDAAGRFNTGYSTVNGKFTTPQALKNVIMSCVLRTDAPTTVALSADVFVGGAQVSSFQQVLGAANCNGVLAGTLQLGDIAANTTVEIQATPSSTCTLNFGALEKMVLSASA